MVLTSYRRLWVLPALILVIGLADRLFPADLYPRQGAQIIVDSQGEPLRRFADEQGVWRYPVTQSEVSEYYLNALLTYEDRWFYQHPGINPIALGRALFQWLKYGRIISGGSTLTMQVARLRYPQSAGGQHGLGGKFIQLLRALQLEWHFSKKEILHYYLNHAPFGGTIEGVETASRHYFGHSARWLTQAQAALLAGLPQAPSYYRPDRHPQRALQQRNKVLQRLAWFKVISNEERLRAQQEDLSLNVMSAPVHAPLLSRQLANQYSHLQRIDSFIHRDLQLTAQQIAADNRFLLPDGASVAMLVMEHGNGNIKAHVGSAEFSDHSRFGHINMVQALRSPGSALKPFIFARALDQGLIHSESLLMDVPLAFNDYRPTNFDVGFSGAVSASEALQKSLNIPAVQLLDQIGARAFYAWLQSANAQLTLPAGVAPSLAMSLGGVDVRLSHLVSLYSSLGNSGNVIVPRFSSQQVSSVVRPLMSSEAAWIVRDMLLQGDRQRPGVAQPLALKTGTSSGYRDAWALAVTDHYTVGVWVGTPDNATMSGHYGAQTAIPLLRALVARLPDNHKSAVIQRRPDNVAAQEICWPVGTARQTLSPEMCDQVRTAWTIDQKTPLTLMQISSHPQQDAKPWVDTLLASDSGLRVDLGCVESTQTHTSPRWPAALQHWINPDWRTEQRIPALDPRCAPYQALLPVSRVEIQGIEDHQRIKRHQSTTEKPRLRARVIGGQPDWYWFLNGELLPQKSRYVTLPLLVPGYYQLSVVDQAGQGDRVEFVVEPDGS
ncbi:penicillin-binding protein 1C [Bacterioplanoides sp.]|uniref:penicillin-binding protein 1C n=1 Tax=Bacterioplanoides sp. TaxID=2066072 RepID=UPI003AFFD16C